MNPHAHTSSLEVGTETSMSGASDSTIICFSTFPMQRRTLALSTRPPAHCTAASQCREQGREETLRTTSHLLRVKTQQLSPAFATVTISTHVGYVCG